MAEEANKHEFKAEVRKVLNILTNSLYTNREIFLRELISNASDALDKLRYRTNCGEVPIGQDLKPEIQIKLDKDKRTLTITDTGVGMTAAELAENLGTIAKSGSEDFIANFHKEHEGNEDEAKDASNIIGRFGVGFYSVFMVADEVKVTSRYAFPKKGEDSTAHVWVSDGLGTYTIADAPDSDLTRGTCIEVHLKEDAEEYAEKYRITSTIQKHSAFIPFPIYVDGEQVNTEPALWREPKSNVTQEQYNKFYKSLTYDNEDPLVVQHIAVDVPVQFSALLFIPKNPTDFFGLDRDYWGLDIYSRRVLIQRKNKDVLPDFLGFVKGVIDIEDLPLNISRETLQENTIIRKIKQVVTKQILGKLETMAKENAEEYEAFWKSHSKVFKLGTHDYAYHERVCALLRFNSSALDDGENGKELLTSLDDYMKRAKEGQKTFWYLNAKNREAAKLNPHQEVFRKKGLEVLYFFDDIDEFAIRDVDSYKEWHFKSVETAHADDLKDFKDVETTEETKQCAPLSDADSKVFDDFVAYIKEELGDNVKDVRISEKLANSPAVLVSPDGLTMNMEKITKFMRRDDSLPVRDLEVNRDHELLRNMFKIYKADKQDPILKDMIKNLFETCNLMDGFIHEPEMFASKLQSLMCKSSEWYTNIRNL